MSASTLPEGFLGWGIEAVEAQMNALHDAQAFYTVIQVVLTIALIAFYISGQVREMDEAEKPDIINGDFDAFVRRRNDRATLHALAFGPMLIIMGTLSILMSLRAREFPGSISGVIGALGVLIALAFCAKQFWTLMSELKRESGSVDQSLNRQTLHVEFDRLRETYLSSGDKQMNASGDVST
jgi:hypothetical protein